MKKIHFFLLSLNEITGGGSHHNAISFIRFLKKQEFEVFVHVLSTRNNCSPKDIKIIEHHIDFSFLNATNALCKLMDQLEVDADLYFLYGVDFTWAGGKYKKKGGKVPVVVYLDSYLQSMNLGQWQGYAYYLKRFLWDKSIGLDYAKHVDSFLAVSPFLLDQYVKFGFPKKRFAIMPNFFKLSDDNVLELEKLTHTPINLLYAGRITRDKGVDMLLNILNQIPGKYNWHLKIIGEGLEKTSCIKITEQLNLNSKVTFESWLGKEALSLEYKNADIFIHPARWPEPFGRTIVEALQYGVPVIVPSQGGSSWIAKGAGVEFQNNDPNSLLKAILTLLESQSIRNQLAAAGKERILMFSESIVGNELLRIIDSLKKRA